MTRPFSKLTKDFDPERRERIEQRKAEIRQCLNLPTPLNFYYGTEIHARSYAHHRLHLEDCQP